MNIGTLIRKYRKEQKKTLKSIAKKAGVSEGFLSQVENNVKSPSVDSLINICDALGINAGDILNQIKDRENLVIIRKQEWGDVDIPHTGFATRHFFSPENRSVIDSAILIIKPGRSIPVRKNIKNGQELLCILKGSVELVQDKQTVPMEAWDTAHFWSDPERQMITNTSNKVSIVFWAGTL